MTRQIKLGDTVYDLSGLSAEGRRAFDMLQYTDQRLQDAQHKDAAFKRAMNAHVAALKDDILKSKTGIDLGSLLSD